jgi:putative hydrolase of the HAD superfamily
VEGLTGLIRSGSRRLKPLPTGIVEHGQLPRNPRAVLFDVYGTLLVRIPDAHPCPAIRDLALRRLIDRHRLDTGPSELEGSLQAAIAGEHARMRARGVLYPEVRIEKIWGGLFPGREPGALREMIVEHELATHPSWPMPGCRSILAALKRRGTVLGIISNAQFYTPLFLQAFLRDSVEALGFSPSLCLYSCDFGIAKPERVLFDLASERLGTLGVAPQETLMIGNSTVDDVAPASKVGFMTVLAALDRRSFTIPNGPPAADAIITGLGRAELLVERHIRP